MMKEPIEMIDIHTHILSGLDDGAKTLEESIKMCRISYQDGIKTIVATPHILPGIYKNDRSTILSALQQLNAAIKKLGVRSSEFGTQNIDPITQRPNNSIDALKILPGADVHFSSDIFQRYEKGEVVTVNDQGRYLMVEFDFQSIPYRSEEVLFQLIMHGMVPIITHPERNLEIIRNPKRYYEMIKMGCLGQVTAMSLTGGFGPEVRRTAVALLKNRWVHIIASDTHSVDRRPPILSSAVRAAERIIGSEEARRMVTEYPQAILEGKKPNILEPIPV